MKNVLLLLLFPVALFAQQQTINIGTSANDHSGDPLRTAFQKVNANFTELYGAAIPSATAGGTNTYTATPDPPFSSLVHGQTCIITFTNANTGSATLNLNGLGAHTLKKFSSGSLANLASGDIPAGSMWVVTYDGTNSVYQISIPSAGSSGTVTSVTSADANATVANTTTTPVITIVSAPKLQTGRTIGTITGDATSSGSSFDGSANNTNALTLATVNSNVGSFGSSTAIPSFTVNAKGLITAASTNSVIAPAGTLSGTTLNSTVVNSSLTSVGTIGAGTWQGTAIADSYISSASTWNSKANSGANTDITSVLLNQTGLVVKGATSNALTIKPNETLSAGRTLNIVTGDASRTLTFSGDATINGTNTGDQTITLSGGASGSGTSSITVTLDNASVTGQALTGYVSGSGTVSATDNILQAIQKLNGNDALKWQTTGTTNVTTPTINGNVTWTQNSQSSTNTFHTWTQAAHTGGASKGLLFSGGAHTGQTGEVIDQDFANNRTVTFANSTTVSTQRTALFRAATYNIVSGGTISDAASLAVEGPSVSGANITIARPMAFWVQSGQTRLDGNLSHRSSTFTISTEDAQQMQFQTNSANRYVITSAGAHSFSGATGAGYSGSGFFSITGPSGSTTNTGTGVAFTAGAFTNSTLSTEITDVSLNLARTVQFATGALTTQRAARIQAPTYSFVGASTITTASTFAISGAPAAGTNATITNAYALNIESGNSYFDGKIVQGATNTAAGTTGNQTINKPTGTVNIAAAGTSVTVTNSLVTSSSIVFCVVRTNDSTALIKNVVPSSGSFTINMNAAVTAETSIGFMVIN